MGANPPQIHGYWLNHGEMAAACGVSTQAFDKWGVKPVAVVGRETYYLVADVVANRLARQRKIGGRYINRAAGKHQPTQTAAAKSRGNAASRKRS